MASLHKDDARKKVIFDVFSKLLDGAPFPLFRALLNEIAAITVSEDAPGYFFKSKRNNDIVDFYLISGGIPIFTGNINIPAKTISIILDKQEIDLPDFKRIKYIFIEELLNIVNYIEKNL